MIADTNYRYCHLLSLLGNLLEQGGQFGSTVRNNKTNSNPNPNPNPNPRYHPSRISKKNEESNTIKSNLRYKFEKEAYIDGEKRIPYPY
jgi:hypothetical protein